VLQASQESLGDRRKAKNTSDAHINTLLISSNQSLSNDRLTSSFISIAVHGVALGLLLIVPYLLPTARQNKPSTRSESVPLYLPPPPRPTRPAPVIARLAPPVVTHPHLEAPAARPVRLPEAAVRPKATEFKPEPAPRIVAAAAPAALPTPPTQAPMQVVPKQQPVTTDVFSTLQPTAAPVKSRETHVGGFGDVDGAKPGESKSQVLAKVGGFDGPAAKESGSGIGHRAGFQETGFGVAGEGAGRSASTTNGGVVKTGAFGDASQSVSGQRVARAKPQEDKATPVEVLVKPKPSYTAEARSLKVEGDVSLEVLFLASGRVQVLRVVHGLGHGLDEVAVQVAKEIQFRPSTRDGVPIDSKAIIRVTFELT
jgi:TonB family protein